MTHRHSSAPRASDGRGTPGRPLDRTISKKREENTMESELNRRSIGSLLAAVLLLSPAAHADNGFSISTSRENVVAVGMTSSEVLQLIGRPARADRYRNMPGPVWTYKVLDPLFGRTEFNVEFGADERVIAKGEVVIGSESPNGGQRD
jgi:hypothetical protein